MIYKTSDLSRKAGDIIAEAMRRPVTLTRHNKPRLVLMNIEDYRRLRSDHDARNAYSVGAAPADMLDELERGLSEYLANSERE